ncbi:DUF1062 domain-containing protein [Micromonospora zingiberis]|uniref:DUF1062 domain-containing protein n=1 Tax=Micromonospora zingiberis TaxID=2053011 RepID=A0A4R0GBG4_9ACTN|nr:DUF1062 domain-containing protein [Micromonospora zingiberis]TCB93363.1 DUF1062 domain-containing protein [Micromonospora zingiberis]
MSTRPHIELSWTLRRTRLPLRASRCVHCHSGLADTGDGVFRVNANGKLLDIWPLVACVTGDRGSKTNLHARVPVRYLEPIRWEDHSGNSSRRGPEPGREARWPCPGHLHRASIRARSLMTGRERRYGPARYRRRG